MFLVVIVLFSYLLCANGTSLRVLSVKVIDSGDSTVGRALSVLSSGKFVLSGSTKSGSTRNGFIQAYSGKAPILALWSNQVSVDNGNAEIIGSTTDPDNNIYAAIRCSGPLNGSTWNGLDDVCIIKYNSVGDVLFTSQAGATGQDTPTAIAVNPADRSFWVVGYTNSASWDGQKKVNSIVDGFLTQFTPTGAMQAVHRFGEVNNGVWFQAVATDSASHVWTTGYTASESYQDFLTPSSSEFMNILVQKTDPSGKVLFVTLIGGYTSHDFGLAIAVDAAGNAFVTGESSESFDDHESAGGCDIPVVKYSSTGTKLWSVLHGGESTDSANGMVFDQASNYLYITGQTSSPLFYGFHNPPPNGYAPSPGSAFLLVLSPVDGSVVYARVYVSSGPYIANTIQAHGAFVYVAGSTSGRYQRKTINGTTAAFALKIAKLDKPRCGRSKRGTAQQVPCR